MPPIFAGEVDCSNNLKVTLILVMFHPMISHGDSVPTVCVGDLSVHIYIYIIDILCIWYLDVFICCLVGPLF